MYILSADKTIFSRLGDLVIEKEKDFFIINEYGEKKYIYTLSNNKYIIGRYINFENARKTLNEIIQEYKSPFTYCDFKIFDVKDDEEEILKCHG